MKHKFINLCFIFCFLINFTTGICCASIQEIYSINEIENVLNQVSPDALVVFDIGETLVVQKNNLLRILRNPRIFDTQDIEYIENIISAFCKQMSDARVQIQSHMILQSPLYYVEAEMLEVIQKLQARQIKVIAHCSLHPGEFGAIKHVNEWRFLALRTLGFDFSSSFELQEIVFNNLNSSLGSYPSFYKGILFGANNPKGCILCAFLDHIDWQPSEVIFIDDCKKYIESIGEELVKRNIAYKGFWYKAAIKTTPKLNRDIVNIQIKKIEQHEYIDDEVAQKILDESKIEFFLEPYYAQ